MPRIRQGVYGAERVPRRRFRRPGARVRPTARRSVRPGQPGSRRRSRQVELTLRSAMPFEWCSLAGVDANLAAAIKDAAQNIVVTSVFYLEILIRFIGRSGLDK